MKFFQNYIPQTKGQLTYAAIGTAFISLFTAFFAYQLKLQQDAIRHLRAMSDDDYRLQKAAAFKPGSVLDVATDNLRSVIPLSTAFIVAYWALTIVVLFGACSRVEQVLSRSAAPHPHNS